MELLMAEIERVKKSKVPMALLVLHNKSWLRNRGNQYTGGKNNNVGFDTTKLLALNYQLEQKRKSENI